MTSVLVNLARAIAGILVVLLLVAATVGLHHATASGSDAWATAVEAVATVVLVAITAWYAYLTYRLIRLQQMAPRAESWEAALRELNRLMVRRNPGIWTASDFFPVDVGESPPMLMEVLESRDALREVRNEVLELVGLLPKDRAGSALGVAAYIVNAETELHALAGALLDETQLGVAEGRSWTWDGARAAHLASDDPERSEAWEDVLAGRHVLAMRERWEKLSLGLDRELTAA